MKRYSTEHMACLKQANPTYHRDDQGRTLAEQCRALGVNPSAAYRAIHEGIPPAEAARFVFDKRIKRMIHKCQKPAST